MNTGPKPGAGRPAGAASFAQKLVARLSGNEPEDWLIELAALADREGLARAGARLNYSAATVSQVISGTYRGDVARVEDVVRGALMGAIVTCPVLGEIGRDRCLFAQKRGQSSANPKMARLRHACPVCPNARRQGGEHAE